MVATYLDQNLPHTDSENAGKTKWNFVSFVTRTKQYLSEPIKCYQKIKHVVCLSGPMHIFANFFFLM